ncbi:MAG: glycerophosphoryl diester phosphodiesterase [Blastocatellia bacterium]|jgi:glycerophosphoryl diester phosphodiesterase|nr:glycerophosphoryl diester phosphodiesterase [Blastocatellia bacterium]
MNDQLRRHDAKQQGRGDAATRRRGETEKETIFFEGNEDFDGENEGFVEADPRRVSASARPRVSSAPLIIGHRGASALAPENTLAAFERALEDGADGLEFDVRLASDRVPVVIHDATLRRTGLCEGSIATLSSIELARVDVGTWFNLRRPTLAQPAYSNEKIPTLAQVFETMKERAAVLYVEMKCDVSEGRALAVETAQLIRAHAFTGRVVVESFTLDALAELKRVAPEIRAAALFEPKLSRPLPSARKIIEQTMACGADEIALHRTLATARTVAAARRRGMNTIVWTVDNPAWVKRAIERGLHALITNQPAQMRSRLDRLLNDRKAFA